MSSVSAESDCHGQAPGPILYKHGFLALAKHMARSQSSEIIPCTRASKNMGERQVGLKCRTSKGVIFEFVSVYSFPGWKGPDGVVWSEDFCVEFPEGCPLDQSAAKNVCKGLRARLPTQADFVRAESNGFREVLPSKHQWYWTSSSPSFLSKKPYVFDANDGTFALKVRRVEEGFRCVTR